MMLSPPKYLQKIREYGFRDSLNIAWKRKVLGPYLKRKWRSVPQYSGPTEEELIAIEARLSELGIPVTPLNVDERAFDEFKRAIAFPGDYHGGPQGPVWEEKLLEYMIAYRLCELSEFSDADIYIDIAGAASPWATLLRNIGITAYSVDLKVPRKFKHLEYYLERNAICTNFKPDSVRSTSLQCAFEMFIGDSDGKLIDELGRILVPGGKAVIVPLYLHTHHCGYSSPEYFGKGHADSGSVQYMRTQGWGVPFSRKYSPDTLISRVLTRVRNNGMYFKIFKVENKERFGSNVYCHFVMEIVKNG